MELSLIDVQKSELFFDIQDTTIRCLEDNRSFIDILAFQKASVESNSRTTDFSRIDIFLKSLASIIITNMFV